MHTLRALLPSILGLVLLAPLLPLWLITGVQAGIRAACTTFEVRPGSVRSSYRFLTTSVRDFTYDKITGVAVREGPLDRLLGTVTVELWSIGAGEPLVLAFVRRSELNLEALLRQAGIPESEPLAVAPARFGLGVAILAHLGRVAVLVALTVGLAIPALLWSAWALVPLVPVAVLVAVALLYAELRYRRVRATLFDQHVEVRDGLLWRDTYRARYANIKKTTLVRYPGSSRGSVRFFVAGERRVEARGGQRREQKKAPMRIVPYGFTVPYVEDLDRKAALLDGMIERPEPARAAALVDDSPLPEVEDVARGRPDIGNGMVVLVVLSAVFVVGLPLLPVTAPLLFWSLRRRSYHLEPDRAVYRSGILYRRQTSVLFDRIDAIRHQQGPLNKVFRNGSVVILTAGSSAPDLVLTALSGHLEFHEEIQRRYRRLG